MSDEPSSAPAMSSEAPRHRGQRRAIGLALLIGLALAYGIWIRVAVPGQAPRIGVSLDTAWHSQLGISSRSYEIALTRAGGRSVELRPDARDVGLILDGLDALLVTGGGDVDPAVYGRVAGVEAKLVDRTRDEFELSLLREAIARDMPVLGICRGIQMLNVAEGGTLGDHRSDPAINGRHGIRLGSLRAHEVELVKGTKLAAILGPGRRTVSSFHGQAVRKVGARLRVAARASDGIIEALERPDRRFVMGIQWHPELQSLLDSKSLALFRALVKAASRRRRASAGR